ncbi:CC/Se motif family (seleno)protein [Halomonas sp. LS-001]
MPTDAIDISQAAAEYIREKGGVLTVRLSPRHGCCGGVASLAIAEARTPDNIQAFTCHKQDGIKLYLTPELVDEGLRVDIEGWWKLRHLYVEGAAIHSPRQR